MKIIPGGRDIEGNIVSWDVVDDGSSSSNGGSSGGGYGGSDPISTGITLATIAIIFSIILIPLTPIFYFIIKNKIKKLREDGQEPENLLLIAHKVTKVIFILQIISLVFAIIIGIITLIIGINFWEYL